jgi:hypothetical protein
MVFSQTPGAAYFRSLVRTTGAVTAIYEIRPVTKTQEAFAYP